MIEYVKRGEEVQERWWFGDKTLEVQMESYAASSKGIVLNKRHSQVQRAAESFRRLLVKLVNRRRNQQPKIATSMKCFKALAGQSDLE